MEGIAMANGDDERADEKNGPLRKAGPKTREVLRKRRRKGLFMDGNQCHNEQITGISHCAVPARGDWRAFARVSWIQRGKADVLKIGTEPGIGLDGNTLLFGETSQTPH
ncbi:MAG: hypothetical protein SWE60_15240 [Thermodesulfobacteriota bacterium]|nr:hypothetical protein [Thermodesulfobacteriota bacterium]